jgi:nucleoside-diphosphate-sugar epimerase
MSETHVIFGSGPLAQAVMRALLQDGQAVRMINRSGKRPADVPEQVEMLGGDAYSTDFTRQAARGAAVVYQCAQPPYHQWPEKFPPLQAAILEGAAANQARLIVGENLYMYGDTHGTPMTESTPVQAHTRKGKTRAQMSEALLAAHRSGRVQVSMARGADFYGPGVLESALGERAILPALQGKAASLVGKLDLPHTYTYISDFGKAMVILGQHEEALGQAWHVPNPPALTQRELMTLFFQEIGLSPKMSGMGKTMMAIGGLFVSGARETVEMMYEFEQPFLVDSSKFTRAFSMQGTSHQEAVQATVSWYRRWAATQSAHS